MDIPYFIKLKLAGMITIGIDPSLNSTGICINKNGKCTYYIIVSKMTRKMAEFKNDYIHIISYPKSDTNKKTNRYDVIEENKARNIYNICSIIGDIIKQYKNECVCVYMEGVSYGSVGSAALVDLSGLNFALRNVFIEESVPFCIVSPSQNKKAATGNGAADKELMVFSWLMVEKHLKNIKDIKIDDLADAFFLSNFERE